MLIAVEDDGPGVPRGAARGDLRAVPPGTDDLVAHSPGTGIGLSLVARSQSCTADVPGSRTARAAARRSACSSPRAADGRSGRRQRPRAEALADRRQRGGWLDSNAMPGHDHNPRKRRLHLPIVVDERGPRRRTHPRRMRASRLAEGPAGDRPERRGAPSIMRGLDLHTVCEEAMCPNIDECWEEREATFLILGDRCTRRCGFCDVMTASPDPVDEDEPARIAERRAAMGLRFVVLTGVARDDLPDGGARIWAATIRAVREAVPGCGVEVLPTDFKGGERDIATVIEAEPDVFAHNLETVRRLHGRIRPAFGYDRSLEVLRIAKRLRPARSRSRT